MVGPKSEIKGYDKRTLSDIGYYDRKYLRNYNDTPERQMNLIVSRHKIPPKTPPYSPRNHHYNRERSRSRSLSPYGSHSKRSDDPYNGRKYNEYQGRSSTRERPLENKCLGVFGLSERSTESDIYGIFSRFGPIREVKLIMDSKTGRSRGYCFVYFDSLGDAIEARESSVNLKIDSRMVRVDYSITHRPRSPFNGRRRYR